MVRPTLLLNRNWITLPRNSVIRTSLISYIKCPSYFVPTKLTREFSSSPVTNFNPLGGKGDPELDLDALKKSPELQQVLKDEEIVAEFKVLVKLLAGHGFTWATAKNPLTLLKIMGDSEVRAQLKLIQNIMAKKGIEMDPSILQKIMKK